MELVNEFVVPRPIDQAWQVLTDVELIAPCLPGAQLTEVEGDLYRGVVKVKVGPILARFAGQAHFTERDEANHRAVLDARGKEATGKGLASATVTAQLRDQGDSTRVEVTTQLTISGKIAQFGRGALADISTKLLDQFAVRLEETLLSQETAAPPDAEADAGAEADAEADAGAEAEAGVDTGTGVDAEAGATGQAAPAEQPAPVESDGVAEAAPAPSTPPVVAQPSPPAGGVRVIEGPEAEPVNLLGAAGAPILKRLVPVLLAIVVIVVIILVIALN